MYSYLYPEPFDWQRMGREGTHGDKRQGDEWKGKTMDHWGHDLEAPLTEG